MKKILLINGSPKANSDTLLMTEAFLKGYSEAASEPFELETVTVREKTILPCLGCFQCWDNRDGHCVQNDDMNDLLDLYEAADYIFLSFPLYIFSVPAPMKAFLDRTLPLVRWGVEMKDGVCRHLPLHSFNDKKTVIFCGGGLPEWGDDFTALRTMCRNYFVDPLMLCVSEAPLLPGAAFIPPAAQKLSDFEAAGREWAATASLSEETIARLESLMMPLENYMAYLNNK